MIDSPPHPYEKDWDILTLFFLIIFNIKLPVIGSIIIIVKYVVLVIINKTLQFYTMLGMFVLISVHLPLTSANFVINLVIIFDIYFKGWFQIYEC